MRLILSALLVIGVSLAWTAPPAQSQAATPNPAKVAVPKMALRDLHIKHIFWVRSLVISTRLGEKTAINEADVHALDNAQTIGQSIAASNDCVPPTLAGVWAWQRWRDEPPLCPCDPLRRIRVERGALGRRVVRRVPDSPVVERSGQAHDPDKLVALLDDPSAVNGEAKLQAQRTNAPAPGVDKIIEPSFVNRVPAQLPGHHSVVYVSLS